MQHFHAVDLGHADVEQQHVGLVHLALRPRPAAEEIIQNRLPVGEVMDAIGQPGLSQCLLDENGVALVIFGDEDNWSVLHSFS